MPKFLLFLSYTITTTTLALGLSLKNYKFRNSSFLSQRRYQPAGNQQRTYTVRQMSGAPLSIFGPNKDQSEFTSRSEGPNTKSIDTVGDLKRRITDFKDEERLSNLHPKEKAKIANYVGGRTGSSAVQNFARNPEVKILHDMKILSDDDRLEDLEPKGADQKIVLTVLFGSLGASDKTKIEKLVDDHLTRKLRERGEYVTTPGLRSAMVGMKNTDELNFETCSEICALSGMGSGLIASGAFASQHTAFLDANAAPGGFASIEAFSMPTGATSAIAAADASYKKVIEPIFELGRYPGLARSRAMATIQRREAERQNELSSDRLTARNLQADIQKLRESAAAAPVNDGPRCACCLQGVNDASGVEEVAFKDDGTEEVEDGVICIGCMDKLQCPDFFGVDEKGQIISRSRRFPVLIDGRSIYKK